MSFLFPEEFGKNLGLIAQVKVWGPCSLEALPNLICKRLPLSCPLPLLPSARRRFVFEWASGWHRGCGLAASPGHLGGWVTNSPAWRLSLKQMREVREGGAGEREGRDSPLTLPLLENLELRPSHPQPGLITLYHFSPRSNARPCHLLLP